MQVASASQVSPSTAESVEWHEEAAQLQGVEAQHCSPEVSASGEGLHRAADPARSSLSVLHLHLPHLLTTLNRVPSDELASSSRASSQIPAHSALSRMLQDSSIQEHSHPGDANQVWGVSGSESQQVAGGSSPDSAALQQLLHVVEGLEEELFSSESRRNDAEVSMIVSMYSLATRCSVTHAEDSAGCAQMVGSSQNLACAAVLGGHAGYICSIACKPR